MPEATDGDRLRLLTTPAGEMVEVPASAKVDVDFDAGPDCSNPEGRSFSDYLDGYQAGEEAGQDVTMAFIAGWLSELGHDDLAQRVMDEEWVK